MLSQPDINLVQRDKAIPGLETLLDPELFVKRLRISLPNADIRAAQPRYIRYKPGMNCLIAYRLKTGEKWIDVYAKAHSADAADKLHKAKLRKTSEGPFGPGRMVLNGLDIVVSFFPNDSKLKRLHRLLDNDFKTKIAPLLTQNVGELQSLALSTLRYKPERRYVGRLETGHHPAALLKIYAPNAFEKSYVSNTAIKNQGLLRVPECLGKSDRYALIAFEWLPGDSLAEIIRDGKRNYKHAATDTGAALANFHAQMPDNLPVRTADSEVGIFLERAEWLGYVDPRFAEQAKKLAWKLAAWFINEPMMMHPIHGDFYAEQVLWSNRGVGIIDLDETVMGDPRMDIGAFAAHLEYNVLHGNIATDVLTNILNNFYDGYKHANGAFPEDNLKMFIAAELFKRSHAPFRTCETEWHKHTTRILDRVVSLIIDDRAGSFFPGTAMKQNRMRNTNVLIEDAFDAVSDSAMPFLTSAIDPWFVEPSLEKMLFDHSGKRERIELLNIRVLRHKPRRRCLIEYDFTKEIGGGQREVMTLLGKARARGLDARTYRLGKILWDSGFNHQSIDGISVPRPIGVIPELNMWFQKRVSGTLATQLIEKERNTGLAKRIAEAIHKVHRLEFAPRRRHTMQDELRILHERLPLLTETHPQWTSRLNKILAACDRIGATITEVEPTCIHRDFYPDQVLVSGDWLYLIDFDLFCLGDPALDAGNFLGHVTEQSLRNLGNPAVLAAWENAFVEHFIDLNGEYLRHNIQVYKMLTLARHIYISTLFPERRLFTEQLITLCERQLMRAISNPEDRGMLMQA